MAEMGLLPQALSLLLHTWMLEQEQAAPLEYTDFSGSSSRGTAGQTIWQFLPGYLTSDALTVLANSRSTQRYLVPSFVAIWSFFLLPEISPGEGKILQRR